MYDTSLSGYDCLTENILVLYKPKVKSVVKTDVVQSQNVQNSPQHYCIRKDQINTAIRHVCAILIVFLMSRYCSIMPRLFLAALWSPVGKGTTLLQPYGHLLGKGRLCCSLMVTCWERDDFVAALWSLVGKGTTLLQPYGHLLGKG